MTPGYGHVTRSCKSPSKKNLPQTPLGHLLMVNDRKQKINLNHYGIEVESPRMKETNQCVKRRRNITFIDS